MRLGSVAALFLLSCLLSLPLAAAQAPPLPPAPPVPEPDPGEVVALACATVGGPAPDLRDALPVCPKVEPAGPGAPGEDDHVHDPAQVPGTPQDVPDLAQEVLEDIRKVPEDPASAPDRLLAILATVVQFLRDLVSLPVQAGFGLRSGLVAAVEGVVDGIVDTAEATARVVVDGTKGARDAAAAGLDAVKQGAGELAQKVRNLFDPLTPEAPVEAPRASDVQRDARETADGLLELARGEVGQVLAEG